MSGLFCGDVFDWQGWKPEKNLRFLLQKVLKQSDVGSLGRIVLPKVSVYVTSLVINWLYLLLEQCIYIILHQKKDQCIYFLHKQKIPLVYISWCDYFIITMITKIEQKEAETHLPELEARDGISITMEDIGTSRVWNMRYRYAKFHWRICRLHFVFIYNTWDWSFLFWIISSWSIRYWPNNKSRMYLLENTGGLINQLTHYPFVHFISFSLSFDEFISFCRWLCESQWTPRGRFHSDIFRCKVWQICKISFSH